MTAWRDERTDTHFRRGCYRQFAGEDKRSVNVVQGFRRDPMTKKEQIQKRRQEILVMLRASDREHPVPLVQLMEQFDASRRTIYDDIKALQESGYGVETVQKKGFLRKSPLPWRRSFPCTKGPVPMIRRIREASGWRWPGN